MNKKSNFNLLMLFTLITALFSSCSSDDNFSTLGENKLPSLLKKNNEVITSYSYDSQNRLIQIDYANYKTVTINYESDEPVSLSFVYSQGTGGVQIDGTRTVKFSKQENNIMVAKFTMPSNFEFSDSIYFDNNGFVSKIYVGESTILSQGIKYPNYYGFEYENERLSKVEGFHILNGQKITDATMHYEYDDKSGIVSQINCPRWFYIVYRFLLNDDAMENLLNYKNNIVKETITNDHSQLVVTNSYKYDNSGYPYIWGKGSGDKEVTIQYQGRK